MTTADAARVAAARRWFRERGHAALVEDGVTIVATPAHPLTWDANWVIAGPGATPAAVFAVLDRHFGHTPWRVAHTDCLTDPAVEAALALAGFEARNVLIEMVARATASPHPLPVVTLAPVDDAGWDALARLVAADHAEGRRTGTLDQAVAAGLVAGMRRRPPPCAWWLLVADGAPVGYGMTAACPGGLGLLEDLFTLPEQRGRGLMSAFIVAAAARLRADGCEAVFLDAHAGDMPKRLYHRLGFQPVAMGRTWVRKNAPANRSP